MATSRSMDDGYSIDKDEMFIYDSSSDDDALNTNDSNQFFATMLTDLMGVFASNLGFSNFYHTNPNNIPLMFASTFGLPVFLSAVIASCNKLDSKNVAIVGMKTGLMNIVAYQIGTQLGFQPLTLPNIVTTGFLISCFVSPLIRNNTQYLSLSDHLSSLWRRPKFRKTDNLKDLEENAEETDHLYVKKIR